MARDTMNAAVLTERQEAALDRLDRLANTLDSRFSVLGFRFGWDSIIGLVPGIGDAIAGLISLYIVFTAASIGASTGTVIRMTINVLVDMAVGSVPLAGDAFDAIFKANRRNIRLLRRHLERDAARVRVHEV